MAHISGTNTGSALTLLTESGATCVLAAGAFTTYLNESDLVALQRSGILDSHVTNGRLTTVGVSYDDGPTLAASVQGIDDLTVSKLIQVGPIAAKDADIVHALYDGATAAFPGPFTNPVSPRNLRVTYSADWDGGTVTIVGTNQFDEEVSEVFAAGDAEVVVGAKVFKTVTGATKSVAAGVAGDGASIGTGDTVGLPVHLADEVGMLSIAGVLEAVTLDDTYDSFTPTTVPSATTYQLLVNYNP